MYNCRNCGGNLRFDIPSQRLKCPYCDSDYDCYEFDSEESSDDKDSYDVTVFSCPACGAEIISNDQSVAEFCSYCGSSVVLDSRLRKEKRPQKILPFQKTSEDCIEAYKNKLKGSLFAPGILKDPKFLENFRGIYIPYWSYSFSHKGPVSLTSSHDYRKGDYDITDYYHVSGNVDARYEGILFDASSAFDDSISKAIAPFDPKQMKDFVPSYLSGFYADVSDVPSDVYRDDANNLANEETIRHISRDPVAGKYRISQNKFTTSMNKDLCTEIDKPAAAMLPVWFLTWRDQDRVAYMAVNGQTGKVAADIPIDIRKYLLAAIVCAIPIYFILNFLVAFKTSTTLFFAGLFSLITGIIYYEEITSIRKKDNRELDRGFQRIRNLRAKKNKKKSGEQKDLQTDSGTEATDTEADGAEADGADDIRTVPVDKGSVGNMESVESAVERNSKKGKEKAKMARPEEKQGGGKAGKNQTPLPRKANNFGIIASFVILMIGIFMGYSESGIFGAIFNRFTLNTALIFGVFALWWFIFEDGDEVNKDYKPHIGILGSQLVTILAAIINIIHPVSDLIYYIGIIIVYAGIFITLIQIIRKYNLLITRPIPELHNRGKEQP